MEYMDMIVPFAGGLGLFIYGMHIMAQGLENAAGSRLKRLLEVLTKSRLAGVLLGAAVTAVIQSSSATTVMVVGFVNAGIMNLSQAMSMIMGANIGTTVTGWLVSSVEWAKFLSPASLAPAAVIIGVVLMLIARNDQVKEIASVIIGFGILFIGISMMSDAAAPLRNSESFRNAFVAFGKYPVLGILAGAAVTAIIQSSSASIGILQTLAASGLVPFSSAVYIIMGQNIGTCATAMLSGIGAKKTAKTAAYMHLLFNVIGSALFCAGAIIFFRFINPNLGERLITQTQISGIHTVFNVVTTIVLFPFSEQIISLARKFGRADKEQLNPAANTAHLDDRILETPSIAIQSAVKEVVRMGQIAEDCIGAMKQAVTHKDLKEVGRVRETESTIDELSNAITEYLVKAGSRHITTPESETVTAMLQVIIDIERISDYCENITELVTYMKNENLSFSRVAAEELADMMNEVEAGYAACIRALAEGAKDEAVITAESEKKVDEMEDYLRTKHILRLSNMECQPKCGVAFLDMLMHLERISDHSLNIAQVVLNGYKIKLND